MATKPTDTVPVWPSNAVYSAGPSVGLATTVDPTPFAANGHIEGVSNPTGAQVQNGWQKPVGKWCNWVEAGSFTGAADSHIVETTSTGKTSVQRLNVLGTNGTNEVALDVDQDSASQYTARLEHSTGSSVLIGGSAVAMQVAGSAGGVYIVSSGDSTPLILEPQTTRPTTFSGKNGSVYIEKVVQAGDDAHAMRMVGNSTRMSVALYRDQFVHAWQEGDSSSFNGDVTAQTTIINSALIFFQGLGPLDANIPMMFDISMNAQSSTTPSDFIVAFKNNGSTIQTFNVHIPTASSHNVFLRGRYLSGALALDGNNFTVTAYKYVSGGAMVTVDNVIARIQSVR